MFILQRLNKLQTPEVWVELYRCRYKQPLRDAMKRLDSKTHRIVEEN